MSHCTQNWTEPTEIADRAAAIGFPLDVLRPTIEVWIAGMNSGTPLHANNFPGTIAWHQAIPTLRLEGLRYGLQPVERKGVQLCVCSQTQAAVVITQGDSRTGDTENLHLKPSTKYPRGPMSCAVLTAQTSLFPEESLEANTDPYDVWILLLHMTPTGQTRAELSLPAIIDEESGTILDWHERIFLGTFDGQMSSAALSGADLSPTHEIDVPVRKRS